MTQHLFDPRCTLGRSWRPMLLAGLLLLGLARPAHAANLYVSPTGADTNDGSAATPFKTLAFAIIRANANDTINMAAGTYGTVSGEIFELSITKNLTIIGAGPNDTIIAGTQTSRIFSIPGTTVVLKNLGITGGKATIGGGILNQGDLTLDNVDVFENEATDSKTGTSTASAFGGGISSQGNLTIINSKVRNNNASATSADGNAFVFGAGINLVDGIARIINSIVSGNRANVSTIGGSVNANGGGIRIDGPPEVTISSSTVYDNIVQVSSTSGNMFVNAAGIDNRGKLKMDNSTVGNNTIDVLNFIGSGDLILNAVGINNGVGATLTVINSTVSGNTGSFSGFTDGLFLEGAGVNTDGVMIAKNSTFSGNTINVSGTSGDDQIIISGVGINNGGTAALTNVTVTLNAATVNGNGGNDFIAISGGGTNSLPGGGVVPKNSIIAHNTPADIAGSVSSAGFNLIGDNSLIFKASSDLDDTDPLLGPLASNGGLTTQTHALLAGSPAIDAGDNVGCPPTDQGGFRRPVDGNGDATATCDIGAVERVTIATTLLGAVLPTQRTPLVGGPAVTASATVLNTGLVTATGCAIAPFTPVAATFIYQTLNAQGGLSGTPNTPADIPAGQGQSFVLVFAATAPFPLTELTLSFACTNSAPAPSTPVSNFGLRGTQAPASDIVALVAVGPPNDGILRLASVGAFAVATVNVGASGLITVTADTGGVALPVSLFVCETNPGSGQCLADPTPTSVQTQINAGATPTFGVFVINTAPIAFDPTNNRIRVRFEGGGGGGGTSVAVCSQPLCPP